MEVLIVLVLILLNGVFAMSELALVSAKRVRLEKMAAGGRGGARTACWNSCASKRPNWRWWSTSMAN